MAESDELYTLRNAFFLGNFQEALAEASTIPRPKSDLLRLERDVLVARAHIALGDARAATAGIRDDAPAPMRAVKLFAAFSAAAPGSAARASVLASVDALVTEAEADAAGTTAAAATAPLVAALAGTMCVADERARADPSTAAAPLTPLPLTATHRPLSR